MELTYEQYRMMRKDLRRRFSVVGWVLLLYYLIMNASVFLAVFVETMVGMIGSFSSGDIDSAIESAQQASQSGWGYVLAVAVGLLILLLWKKPAFWKNEIWAKGKPMKPGSFLAILCIFLSGQLVYQIVMIVVELILNSFGLSVMAGMEAVSMDTTNFSMFLYGGILAPVTEELLFRGLIQRTLQPYGKRFAILCSAFTFGIFHGNLLQAPYAFLVGLVLGYVASEYSIAWAMVLHMVNNLVLGDMITRLTSGMSEMVTALVIWMVLLFSAVAALVTLIVKRKDIRMFRWENPINRTCVRCFFSCPGTIILMVLMGLNMITSLFVMITPL